jgi:hypothetical protein
MQIIINKINSLWALFLVELKDIKDLCSVSSKSFYAFIKDLACVLLFLLYLPFAMLVFLLEEETLEEETLEDNVTEQQDLDKSKNLESKSDENTHVRRLLDHNPDAEYSNSDSSSFETSERLDEDNKPLSKGYVDSQTQTQPVEATIPTVASIKEAHEQLQLAHGEIMSAINKMNSNASESGKMEDNDAFTDYLNGKLKEIEITKQLANLLESKEKSSSEESNK